MFGSTTKRERMSVREAGLVIAIAAGLFVAQASVLAGGIAKPLETAMAGIARNALPTFGEEITVVAPSRPAHAGDKLAMDAR